MQRSAARKFIFGHPSSDIAVRRPVSNHEMSADESTTAADDYEIVFHDFWDKDFWEGSA